MVSAEPTPIASPSPPGSPESPLLPVLRLGNPPPAVNTGEPPTPSRRKRRAIQVMLVLAAVFATADFVYKTYNHINYINRNECLLYRVLPRFWFVIFENFFELIVLVLLGVFVAAVIEAYMTRLKRFMPSNPVSAFVYGSILPVCACTTIPIVATLQDKLKIRTLITFVVAAPLLNPYIIVLSLDVLGPKYSLLRIAGAFVISVSSGFVLEFFYTKTNLHTRALARCVTAGNGGHGCLARDNDLFLKTYRLFKSVLPYLIIAGVVGVALEYLSLDAKLWLKDNTDSVGGMLLMILGGVPLYFCNGSDVLLLRPLVCAGLPLGTAIAFSLTGTAICIASALMLVKFMGKVMTAVLIAHITLVSVAIALLINAVMPV
jgi:hypothetical protein